MHLIQLGREKPVITERFFLCRGRISRQRDFLARFRGNAQGYKPARILALIGVDGNGKATAQHHINAGHVRMRHHHVRGLHHAHFKREYGGHTIPQKWPGAAGFIHHSNAAIMAATQGGYVHPWQQPRIALSPCRAIFSQL